MKYSRVALALNPRNAYASFKFKESPASPKDSFVSIWYFLLNARLHLVTHCRSARMLLIPQQHTKQAYNHFLARSPSTPFPERRIQFALRLQL